MGAAVGVRALRDHSARRGPLRLADGLPDASVRAVPGAGHFLLLTHGEEILQSLVGA